MQRIASWVIAVSPEPLRPFWLRLRSSSVGKRLARGTFWTVMGAVISRLLGLLSSIILARFLGKVPFGELGIIQSTVGLFGAFAGLGIGITATKYVAEWRELEPARCGRVIGFSLSVALAGGALAGLGLLIFGGWLATHTLAAPQLAPLLRVGAWLVVFNAIQGAYLGALTGFEAFKEASWVNWSSSVIGVPLTVAGALLAGLPGAIWAMVLQMALSCALGHWALARETVKAGVQISFKLSPHEWAMLWRFTLPVCLSTLLAAPAGWFSRTVLVNQYDGYGQAALVSAANQWMNLVNFLPWTMGAVLVPIFANLYATGRHAEFMKLLRQNLLLNAGVGLAVAVPLMLFSSLILACYGPGFREGTAIFILSMISSLFIAFNNLFSRAMQSAGKAWVDLTSNVLWTFVIMAGSFPLVHYYRGLGLVAVHTFAAIVLMIWQWVVIRRFLKQISLISPPTVPANIGGRHS